MTVTKLSISLMPEVFQEIELREEGNTSGTINKCLERYFMLLARTRAELRECLSEEECALILDAINGVFHSTHTIFLLWIEIKDAIELNSLDRVWKVNGPTLIAKIKNAGLIGQAALIDGAECWWKRKSAGEQPVWQDLLR